MLEVSPGCPGPATAQQSEKRLLTCCAAKNGGGGRTRVPGPAIALGGGGGGKLASSHMFLCEAHHASIVFANWEPGVRRPPTPAL